MKEELKDLAWSVLPKECRKEIKFEYAFSDNKEILGDIFGHHNLTSDEEPEEMLYVSKDKVLTRYNECCSALQDESLAPELRGYERGVNTVLRIFFLDTCLPPEPSEQKPTPPYLAPCTEPKYKIGDKVTLVGEAKISYNGVGTIIEVRNNHGYAFYRIKEHFALFAEQYLAPYTEPEPQQTKDMEEKELNLAELLRKYNADKIYLVDEGEVELVEIIDKLAVDVKGVDGRPIGLRGETLEIKPTGFAYIYPSKEAFLKYPLEASKAWKIWAEERKPKRWRAKLKEYYWRIKGNGEISQETENGLYFDDQHYNCGNYFRTKEEVDQAAETVKRTLEEYHEKNAEK